MLSGLVKKGVLKVSWKFCRGGVFKRIGEIFLRQETVLAAAFGVGSFFVSFPHADVSGKVTDICVAYVGYAAIALGFCVGGITIALTFPDRDFVSSLAQLSIEDRGDALSSLLFVFCWTAIVHWISIVTFVLILLFDGRNDSGVLINGSVQFRLIRGVAVFLSAYALMQFLITVLTLWQVGARYIDKLQQDALSAADPSHKSN